MTEIEPCIPYMLHWTFPVHWTETDHIVDPTDQAAGYWYIQIWTMYRGDNGTIDMKCTWLCQIEKHYVTMYVNLQDYC